jgi:hypothetical protein
LKKCFDFEKQKINIKETSEKNREMESDCTYGWATTLLRVLGCALRCSGQQIGARLVKPIHRSGRWLHRAAHPGANKGVAQNRESYSLAGFLFNFDSFLYVFLMQFCWLFGYFLVSDFFTLFLNFDFDFYI